MALEIAVLVGKSCTLVVKRGSFNFFGVFGFPTFHNSLGPLVLIQKIPDPLYLMHIPGEFGDGIPLLFVFAFLLHLLNQVFDRFYQFFVVILVVAIPEVAKGQT